eukprot:TRINITY_DN2198_c2_g1_i1.p1 TRINITY_DN2198_c2_g1~~TRINITY_DN2198_c2_g1_i1.p1  ORF type:complete len:550 (+),score=102.75 TRINITY_DN2198_c2_g1_i1:120-1652(+)
MAMEAEEVLLPAGMKGEERYVTAAPLALPGVCYLSFTLKRACECRVVLNNTTSPTRSVNAVCVCVVLRPRGKQRGSAITGANGSSALCTSHHAGICAREGGAYFVYVAGGTVIVGSVEEEPQPDGKAVLHHRGMMCLRGYQPARDVRHVGFASWDEEQTVLHAHIVSNAHVAASNCEPLARWNCLRACATPIGAVPRKRPHAVACGPSESLILWFHSASRPPPRNKHERHLQQSAHFQGAFTCTDRVSAEDTVAARQLIGGDVPTAGGIVSYLIQTETDLTVFVLSLAELDAAVAGIAPSFAREALRFDWHSAHHLQIVLRTTDMFPPPEVQSPGLSLGVTQASLLARHPSVSVEERVGKEQGAVTVLCPSTPVVTVGDLLAHSQAGMLVPAPGFIGPWDALTCWTELYEPGIVTRLEHVLPSRVAPHFTREVCGCSIKTAVTLAVYAKAYEFATRAVLRTTNWHLSLAPPSAAAYCKLMGFEVNNHLHGDLPCVPSPLHATLHECTAQT